MANILVVDDQRVLRKNLAFYLKSQGHAVDTADSGEEALEKIKDTYFDIIISDYKMGNLSGFDLMKKTKQLHPTSQFIIMTAFGNISLAVEMVRNGASDFVPKPFDYVTILEKINTILKNSEPQKHKEAKENTGMVIFSQKMKDVEDLSIKAANSDITVHIEGEYGTGKRTLAKMIHGLGKRSGGEFITVECSNNSETILEREIFGTDDPDEPGALTKANGGTLLFRDIDKLYPNLQLRMIRFLREGTYLPAIGSSVKKSDIRIIAATTCNLKRLVANSAFREDLYYQLNVMPIYIPPLRARVPDLAPLVKYFIANYRAKLGKNITGISDEAMNWMKGYNWPGNIQELENILARACTLAAADILDESLIFTLPQDRPSIDESPGYLNMTLKDNQKTLILKALKQNNNNYSRTASQLGISRTTLWRRMKKFKIEGVLIKK
ncbi:MAG: sigma-54 dependent transcriptional regulator [candidate division Zixibacteria bacterium]